MVDRATYLARALVTRVRSVAAASMDEPTATEARESVEVETVVAKVLVVETGITDGAIVRRVVNALPTLAAERPPTDRELAELADFLRKNLPESA